MTNKWFNNAWNCLKLTTKVSNTLVNMRKVLGNRNKDSIIQNKKFASRRIEILQFAECDPSYISYTGDEVSLQWVWSAHSVGVMAWKVQCSSLHRAETAILWEWWTARREHHGRSSVSRLPVIHKIAEVNDYILWYSVYSVIIVIIVLCFIRCIVWFW